MDIRVLRRQLFANWCVIKIMFCTFVKIKKFFVGVRPAEHQHFVYSQKRLNPAVHTTIRNKAIKSPLFIIWTQELFTY